MKLKFSPLLIFFIILSAFLVTSIGCPNSSSDDTDGDGLKDTDEISIYHTNPDLYDTDGDGYSDGDEITTYQFNPSVNPHKFNPRVADVPKIGLTLQSLPSIVVHYTTSEGSSNPVPQDWGTKTATSRSKDQTTTATKSASHTHGVKLGAEQEYSVTGVKTTVSAEYSYSYTSTASNSTSFSASQTASKRDTYNQCRSYEKNNEYSEANGELQTIIEISNIGDIAFTVKNLYLKATEFDPVIPESLSPVCGLNRDTGTSTFQSFSLAPGESFQLKYGGDMDLGTTHKLLRDTQNLIIDVESYELVDENEKPYVHNTTEIGTKTTSIIIDYGPGLEDSNGNPLVPEKYLVATNYKQNEPGTTLAAAVTDILNLEYEIGTVTCNGTDQTNLKTFNDITADGALTGETAGYWIIIHTYTREGMEGTDWYTPDISYDLSEIEIQAGDNVLIFHTEDKDGDGLTARQELSWGTDDNNTNSDGDSDGNDYEEATDGDDQTHPAIYGPVTDDSVNRESLPDGITLFEHSNYEGDYRTFTPLGDGNILDLSQETLDSGTAADNTVSSVIIKGDFQAALYDQPNFRGKKVILTEDIKYLSDSNANDLASSVKFFSTLDADTLTFSQFAAINLSGSTAFQQFEDLTMGDFVDSGGSGYLELLHSVAQDYFYLYQYNQTDGTMEEVKSFDTNAAFGFPFDRAKDSNDNWIYGDRISSGDFYHRDEEKLNVDGESSGDYLDEIIFMDYDDNIYVIDPRSTASDKIVSEITGYGTNPGDCIGAGNLDGTFPGWEFATALNTADEIEIRYPDNGPVTGDLPQRYIDGDQMTVGELNGDNQAEVIILKHDPLGENYLGEIQIYDISNGNVIAAYTPGVDIMYWDSIAAGDVNGDGIDEIIWGASQENDGNGDIYIIQWDGSEGSGGFTELGSITNVFYKGDRVIAGDLNADGIAEIAHGCHTSGNITVYTKQ